MFNSKQETLLKQPKTSATATSKGKNAFVNAGMKKGAQTLSGNGALKYSETDNPFVTQFGVLGKMKAPRPYDEVARDMSVLYAEDPVMATKFVLYIRLITRKVQLLDGSTTEEVQRGAGLKHEAQMRYIWLAVNHKDDFWNIAPLIPAVGSWKDIFQMLNYDLQYNGWDGKILDWNKFGQLILAGLENPNSSELVKKYLPQIKASKTAKTLSAQANLMISKWICSLLFGTKDNGATYKQYRQLKTSGTAHQWQQLISQGRLKDIDFNTVHGRALAQLVSGKFLANQGLEKVYEKWIESKPIAKYTGYPHELFAKAPQKKYQIDTLNAQFMGLVETAKQNAETQTGLIVVRDTSGSMRSQSPGTRQTCYDIAKALALFFSYMLPDGIFADSWIEFKHKATMHAWKGSTPWERWKNDRTDTIGSTNFQSVISLFCEIKQGGVDESEFPTGILCISDSEFNPTQLGKTNVQTALTTLRNAGFSDEYVNNFKIVLWNLQNSYYGRGSGEKFETYETNVKNVYYFNGYDASVVAFLTGTTRSERAPETAEELFLAAMDQEVLNLVG